MILYVAKSCIVCCDEGYRLRLISSGSVFGGKCFSTSDVLYACYFLIKELVTLKTLVVLCNTLKKEGSAFRNIGKNISLYLVISLANFRLLFNLLLIRPSTARGSGTSILSRWSLQKLTSNRFAFRRSVDLWGGTPF